MQVSGSENLGLQPGQAFAGRYEIRQRLGQGKGGQVFLAWDRNLRRPVAIREHRADNQDKRRSGESVIREAEILARLNHPAIVAVHDVLTTPEGAVLLVLEYAAGPSLGQLLGDEGRLPWAHCAEIGIAACEALAAAHAKGIVHRGIRPSNILIGTDGGARVTDFAIAGPASASAYAAPEQLRGEAHPASDVFSLCCVLLEAATGRGPFDTESAKPLVTPHFGQFTPDSRRSSAPGIPGAAFDMMMRGLAGDPSDRPTAAQLADTLRRSLVSAAEPNPQELLRGLPATVVFTAAISPTGDGHLLTAGLDEGRGSLAVAGPWSRLAATEAREELLEWRVGWRAEDEMAAGYRRRERIHFSELVALPAMGEHEEYLRDLFLLRVESLAAAMEAMAPAERTATEGALDALREDWLAAGTMSWPWDNDASPPESDVRSTALPSGRGERFADPEHQASGSVVDEPRRRSSEGSTDVLQTLDQRSRVLAFVDAHAAHVRAQASGQADEASFIAGGGARGVVVSGTLDGHWWRYLHITDQLAAAVDLLAGDAPPTVIHERADLSAKDLAARLTKGPIGRALRDLAVAEARVAARPHAAWALDSALAANALRRGLDLPIGSGTPLDRLASQRLKEALFVLASLPDGVYERGGRTFRDAVLRWTLSLSEAVSTPSAAQALGALTARISGMTARAEWIEQDVATTRMPVHLGDAQSGGWARSIEICQPAIATGVFEAGAMLRVVKSPGEEHAQAVLPIADLVRRAYSGVASQVDSLERRSGLLRLAALVRGLALQDLRAPLELPRPWVTLFHRVTGATIHAAQLDLDERGLLSSALPMGERRPGIATSLEPTRRVDPIKYLADGLTAMPAERAWAARVMLGLAFEFAAPGQRLRLLRGAEATLALGEVIAGRGTIASTIASELLKQGWRGQPASFPGGAGESPAAQLAARCRSERDLLARDINQRLGQALPAEIRRARLTEFEGRVAALTALDRAIGATSQ